MTAARMIEHPDIGAVELANLFAAVGDEKRLAIVGCLALFEGRGGLVCKQLSGVTSKTNLSYHMTRLREAGLVRIRAEGTRRHVTLRRDELDGRFPGLLDMIIFHSRQMPLIEATLREMEANGSVPARATPDVAPQDGRRTRRPR